MILCYEKLWPDHPFIFHVPCQELPPTLRTTKVRYFQCPSDIKGTIQSLLYDLDDDEMIYWCIDDKYPIALDIKNIEEMHQYLTVESSDDVDGLLYCRCRGMLKNKNLTGKTVMDGQGRVWLERRNYKQIWIHQYLKAKVLRSLFDSFPREIPAAKTMDLFASQVVKPEGHRLFVTRSNFSVFGESTSRGAITRNCLNSMNAFNLAKPPWASEVTSEEITMGYLSAGHL